MGIRVEHGTPSAYTGLGKLAGQAEKKKEQIARSEREIERGEQAASQIRSLKFQEEQNQLQEEASIRARKMAQEWESQKMLLNSQQDFAHEQRLHQSDLEAEARAKEWEVQKMELRSQMDFQREEQERQQKLTRIDNALMTIDKEHDAGHFPDEKQYQSLKNYYEIQKSGIDAPPIGLIQPPKEAQEKDIFTPYNIQKGLGALSTGSPTNMLGIPIQALTTKEEHEKWAEQNWGPSWKTLVPEAVDTINKKFGIVTPVTKTVLKPITDNIIQQYLIAAGNNIVQAKAAAKRDGYNIGD